MNAPAPKIETADYVAYSVIDLAKVFIGTPSERLVRDGLCALYGLVPATQAAPVDPLKDDPTLVVDMRRGLKSRTINIFEVDGLMKRFKAALGIQGE